MAPVKTGRRLPCLPAPRPALHPQAFPSAWRSLRRSPSINNLAFGYGRRRRRRRPPRHGHVAQPVDDRAGGRDLRPQLRRRRRRAPPHVGNLLDLLGRKATLLAASVLLLVGAAVVSLAQNFPVLLLGRTAGPRLRLRLVRVQRVHHRDRAARLPRFARRHLRHCDQRRHPAGLRHVDRMINVWIDTPDAMARRG